MIGTSIPILSLFLVLPIVAERQYKCEPVICPQCQWNFTDTYEQSALRYVTGEIPAPEDGSCGTGVKWINYGADYGVDKNSCCCIPAYTSYAPCADENSVQCPQSPKMGYTEVSHDFYKRILKFLENGPSDGCCPLGQFKWTLAAAYTSTKEDRCTCVTSGKIATRNVSST